MAKELGKVRRAQVLFQGPGAVVDFRTEESPISAIIGGIDDWPKGAGYDPNYIYKVKGKNKEEVEKKGLMKCKQTFPDLSGSGNTGCYVHYSSQVRFGQ